MAEPMMHLLAQLPEAGSDPVRAERTRRRCHARLELSSRVTAARGPRPRGRRTQLWQPLVAVMAVAYVAEAIVQALHVYGR